MTKISIHMNMGLCSGLTVIPVGCANNCTQYTETSAPLIISGTDVIKQDLQSSAPLFFC